MFHPDLRLLRSFAAVAAENSVTRAAQRLCLTQPTVSGQIKELETEIGFALFHRTTRSIRLSAQGAQLLVIVQEILAQTERLRDAVDVLQSSGKTHFRLGAAMYSMDIPERAELLDAFAAAMPEISYAIDNRLQSAQILDLIDEKLDVSVLLGISAPGASEGVARDQSAVVNETVYSDVLERIVLRRQYMTLLVPAGSRLATLPRIRREDLHGQTIAMLNHEHGSALTAPIEAFLVDCGADLIFPAEGNAMAVDRYAERHGICSVGIGWFSVPKGLVACEVEGMGFFLEFAVVLGRGANHAARQFFSFAARWQTARKDEASLAA